ncbi:Aluminum-activated malate transporter 10 [Zea mays]|uniref:Aluminum-activated malate transporter 10 n=1 Tax=Zea mays TaxID=4577 RepID=A0A3L6D9F4_MAIZE|nr:Aluminum-activated malate transporter 10 [Zea mays]
MAGAAAHQTTSHADDGSPEWSVAVPAAAAGHENTKSSRRACCTRALVVCLFSWLAAPMVSLATSSCLWLFSLAAAARDRVVGVARMAWRIGADDPRKVAHGFKMALALTLCSVFYYVKPLYDFTGQNAMWAVLTVVVVFEYTVGGCLYKGLNRAMATMTGAALALGVQWIASLSDKELEPFILSGSLFVFAAAATYSRFLPTMKARFDYGVTIFILTYTLVAVGGYRVNEVAFMARHRLTTIAIGAVICFAVCALVFPVWAGQELHNQVARNMDKLASAVESCVEDYFSEAAGVDVVAGAVPKPALSDKSHGYKAVLNAKASEDSLANLATWEPAHGRFGFRHPYHLYQKVGAAMRSCAYCVDALSACVVSEAQTPAHVKKHLAGASAALGRHCSAMLREASGSVASMTRSGRLALVVGDMNAAALELRDELRFLAPLLEEDESTDTEQEQNITMSPAPAPSLIEALPLFTAASLLLEICTRAEGVVSAVDNLAIIARFNKADHGEETGHDVETAVPTTMSTMLTADVPQETVAVDHGKTETPTDESSADQTPRDQVGELLKVLMRRRSTKKWARGDTKVCPKPPLDFVVHAPSPRSRSMELTVAGHAPVAPSPRHRSVELTSHPPVAPSPRNRSVDFGSHGPVLPSPRNRSMDFGKHGAVLPSPSHRSILGMA